jgi:hypothetical protein
MSAREPRRGKIIDIGGGMSPGARAQAARDGSTLPVPVALAPLPEAAAVPALPPDDRRLVLDLLARSVRDAKRRAPRNPLRRVELAARQSANGIAQLLLDRLTRRLFG